MARPTSISREIQAVRRSLTSIVRALDRLRRVLEPRAGGGRGDPPRRGRKLRLSAARRAALKVQGQYIGHLRQLRPRQKARVKALRASRGVRSAISLARKLARQQGVRR